MFYTKINPFSLKSPQTDEFICMFTFHIKVYISSLIEKNQAIVINLENQSRSPDGCWKPIGSLRAMGLSILPGWLARGKLWSQGADGNQSPEDCAWRTWPRAPRPRSLVEICLFLDFSSHSSVSSSSVFYDFRVNIWKSSHLTHQVIHSSSSGQVCIWDGRY